MKKAVIIGAGFAGCTMANMLKKKGFDITIIEKAAFLGGGVRTFFYKGHPYTYGPRHLNVNKDNDEVWKYLNENIDLRLLSHNVLTLPSNDNSFFSYPPRKDELKEMKNYDKIQEELNQLEENKIATNFEEYQTFSMGQTLYDGFINDYSKKMWGIDDNKELNLDNTPVHKTVLRTKESDYFEGKQYTAYPKNLNGYNDYFDKCVEDCNVYLNSVVEEYDIKNSRIKFNNEWLEPDIIISTISLDELFNYKYNKLKYRGRDFIKMLFPIERITPESYYFLYYAGDEPYTRIVEYKLLTGYKSKETLLVMEIPSDKNNLYPYTIKKDVDEANKYKELLPKNVFSVGRLGTYKYQCMDEIIANCLNIIKNL